MNEGKNAERCAADLKKFDYVYVPAVDWNHTTKVIDRFPPKTRFKPNFF